MAVSPGAMQDDGMFARARNKRYRWTVRCTVAGLLFQVFLTAWHAPVMAFALGADAGPLSRTIVICTGDGLRRITLDRDGAPVDTSDIPNLGKTCPVCLSLAAGDAAIEPASACLPAPARAPAFELVHLDEAVTDRRPFVRCGLDPPAAA